jgi:hypothetical protein
MAGHDQCWELPATLNRDDLAPDSVGVPAPPAPARKHGTDNAHLWLPEGLHAGLHIEHDHRVQTGPFTGGAWKWTWHETVSGWNTVDSMRDVLHAKSAEVHFVIGGRQGTQLPVVIQCLPLDQYGKGLVHLAGQPETNRARTIQVEICSSPDRDHSFNHYDALANLFWLVTHGDNPRVPVPAKVARSFSSVVRFRSSEYGNVKGMHAHRHVPQNNHTDLWLDGQKLLRRIRTAPNRLA